MPWAIASCTAVPGTVGQLKSCVPLAPLHLPSQIAAIEFVHDARPTLTKNEMTVRKVITASGAASLTGTGYAPDGAVADGSGNPLNGSGAKTCRVVAPVVAPGRSISALPQSGVRRGLQFGEHLEFWRLRNSRGTSLHNAN
jgi:hypothetical protein